MKKLCRLTAATVTASILMIVCFEDGSMAMQHSVLSQGSSALPEASTERRLVEGKLPDPEAATVVYELPDWMEKPPWDIKPMPFPSGKPALRPDDPGFSRNPWAPASKKFDLRQSTVPTVEDLNVDRVLQKRSDGTCNIVGSDDERVRVKDTQVFPFSAVVSLSMRYGSDWYVCTGILIAESLVLTAGHCVFDADLERWPDLIVVTPGLNYMLKPYGETYARWYFSPEGWTVNHNWDYDIGLLALAVPIGKTTGTVGYSALDSTELTSLDHTTAGYPFDWDANKMITTSGSSASITANLICSTIDVCSGQSGSGVWVNQDKVNYVVGVVSGYGGGCYPASRVTRLSGNVYDWLQAIQADADCVSGDCCDGYYYLTDVEPCRGSGGKCDIVEFCSGSSDSCPPDAFQATSYECRKSVGACDEAEYCSGSSPVCPSDAVRSSTFECRSAVGVCDVAEFCTGSDTGCPIDLIRSKTAECRPATDLCDAPEYCTGTSINCPNDNIFPSSHVCREPAFPCDKPEYCNGTGLTCPEDGMLEEGQLCDDGNAKTSNDKCSASAECAGKSSSGCQANSTGRSLPVAEVILCTILFAILVTRRRFV